MDASDARYRDAVVDLLGLLACSELVAFQRLAADSETAPTPNDALGLAAVAAAQLRHLDRLRGRLEELEVDPGAAMAPFVPPLLKFHAQTAPADWYESLCKVYVGDGIGTDFYRELAGMLDEPDRSLVLDVCADTGHTEFAIPRLRTVIAEDRRIAGRLALWGRRLLGEAISQAQHVAGEREALVALLLGEHDGGAVDLAGIDAMFRRLTASHTQRMITIGLQP